MHAHTNVMYFQEDVNREKAKTHSLKINVNFFRKPHIITSFLLDFSGQHMVLYNKTTLELIVILFCHFITQESM